MKRTILIAFTMLVLLSTLIAQEAVQVKNDAETRDYALIKGLLRDDLEELALKQISAFLSGYPESEHIEELLFNKGDILFKKGDFESAAEIFREYISRFPEGEDIENSMYFCAVSHKNLDNFTESKNLYEHLIAKELTDKELKISAIEGLCEILHKEGNYTECSVMIDSIEIGLLTKGLLLFKAEGLLRLERFPEAKKLFEELVSEEYGLTDAEIYDSRYYLGLISFSTGKYKESADVLSTLYIKEKRDDVGTVYGWALYKTGNYAEAYDVFREIEGPSGLSEEESGIILLENLIAEGRNQEAISGLNEFSEKYPENIDARKLLVALLLAQDLAGEAIMHQKYIANNGIQDEDNIMDWYRLAELYFYHRMDYASALNVYKKVAEMSAKKELVSSSTLMAAKCVIALGNDKEALELLMAIPYENEESPLLPEVYFLTAEVLRLMDDNKTALEYYKLILNNYQQSEFWKKALFNASLVQRKEGFLKDAAKGMEDYLDRFGSSSDEAVSILSDIYRDLGDYGRCLETLKKLSDPASNDGYHRMGIAGYYLKDYAKARSFFEKDSGARGNYWRGLCYLHEGLTKESLAEFDKALTIDKDSIFTKMSMLKSSEVLLGKGNISEGIRPLDSLVQQGGLYGRLAQDRIEKTYLSRGDIKEAVERIPSFYMNDPRGFIDAAKVLENGLKYLSEGDKVKSAKVFTNVITSFPNHQAAQTAFFYLGELAFETEDYSGAAEYYRKALGFSNQSDLKPKAWFKLGNCYLKEGRMKAAAAEYGKALESQGLTGKEYLIHYLKGLCHQQERESGTAVVEYLEFLKKTPFAVKMTEEKIRIILYLQNEGYFVESNLFCDNILESDASEEIKTEAQFYKAENFKGLNEYDKALVEYLKVTYLHAENVMWAITARFEAGKIYENRGEWQEAVKLYRKIAENHSGSSQGDYAQERLNKIEGTMLSGDSVVTQETLEN